MLIDRRRDRSVRRLELRVTLFGVGAILALVGMATEQPWLINVAIAVLAVGVFVRFLPGSKQE
jgi:hypothetical protein